LCGFLSAALKFSFCSPILAPAEYRLCNAHRHRLRFIPLRGTLGIAEFKKSGFAFANIGPGTRLKIYVEPPATTLELSVGKLQAWLDTNGKTPREQATKVTLKQLLGRV
jgi:hypothetical protein